MSAGWKGEWEGAVTRHGVADKTGAPEVKVGPRSSEAVKSAFGSSRETALAGREGDARRSKQTSSPLAAKVRPQTSEMRAKRQVIRHPQLDSKSQQECCQGAPVQGFWAASSMASIKKGKV